MKTKIKLSIMKLAGIALAIGITITSCKKGDTGPQGPQGNNGVSGIVNTTLTAPASSWTWDNTTKTSDAQFYVAALSQSIVNTGAVMAYEDAGSGIWIPLPSTFVAAANLTYHTSFYFKLNTIQISRFVSDESNPGQYPSTFRLVVIPPAMVKPNVNMNNFAEVKSAYNLTE
jgi:hypothetical protein